MLLNVRGFSNVADAFVTAKSGDRIYFKTSLDRQRSPQGAR